MTIVGRACRVHGFDGRGRLLADWPAAIDRFRVVIPRDFQRVLDATARAEANGEDVDTAVMAAAQGLTLAASRPASGAGARVASYTRHSRENHHSWRGSGAD